MNPILVPPVLVRCLEDDPEENNNNVTMNDEGEMPLFFVMRCGEWWASSPVLRGSRHPCPLLPTTHLADFLFAR